MTSPEYTPSFEQQARVVIMPQTRPLPTWLPAPTVPRPVARRVTPAKKVPLTFRRACGREFRLERAFMLLLALAGVVGIAYGFSCLIDLVQHWAVFNAGVGQFIR